MLVFCYHVGFLAWHENASGEIFMGDIGSNGILNMSIYFINTLQTLM